MGPVAISWHKVGDWGHCRHHPLVGSSTVKVRPREAHGEFLLGVMGPRIVGTEEVVLLKRFLLELPCAIGKLQMHTPREFVSGVVYRYVVG